MTAKIQKTDCRYSKLGKDTLRVELVKLRRAPRKRARRDGVAAKMISNNTMLSCVVKIHKACVKDSEQNQGVLKVARMCGYLDFLPTREGLRRADGPDWQPFPSGSTRLATSVLEERRRNVDEKGCPKKPGAPQEVASRGLGGAECRESGRAPSRRR